MEESSMPLLGTKFPEITVQTTQGTKKLPADYAGSWFVLFSHPSDFTPVCTTEFMAFALRDDEFKKLHTELIGLSVDQVYSHLKWLEWIHYNMGITIPFPVIADSLGNVSRELGMVHENKGSNTVRAVFVVDDKGIIRQILYYPQELGRNVDEILRSINALQISDKNNVAMPANWPNNDFLGDKVILKPAGTEAQIKERQYSSNNGEIECKDWWFCYKDL